MPDLPPPGSSVHLMGVAGAGMRWVAQLLIDAGYHVSGCDLAPPGPEAVESVAGGPTIERHTGHDPAHVARIDMLIRTSAVPPDHPEVEAARAAGARVLKRAEALGALLRGRRLLGVAGTHGKTTITAMTGFALDEAGMDPTVLVGGHVPAWNGHARLGSPDGAVVIEADEFDRSFLSFDPSLALVSSLEPEHLDTYGTLDALREAYLEFCARATDRDGVICCGDDVGALDIASRLEDARTYGFDSRCDVRVELLSGSGEPTRCRVEWEGGGAQMTLAVPGRHNAQNAGGALAAAIRLGADPAAAARGIERFGGVGRRLEQLAEHEGVTVIDDYAHHPTEVTASLDAVRVRYPEARVVVVFQPHLYTRTRDFAPEFARSLEAADAAFVLPIYPAREAPIEGVDASLIWSERPGLSAIESDAATTLAAERVGKERTVVVYMGAGDVTVIARAAAEALREASRDAVGA